MKIAAFFFALCGCFTLSAEEISVGYKSFYSHVKKINKDDTNALQFSFGFKHIHSLKLCGINKAKIHTQKVDIPLKVSPENRFQVPSEKALYMAKAEVVIDLKEPANVCDMSVQLETKPEFLKRQYSPEDITKLYQQYEAFFDNMGSFLSFLMPEMRGVTFHFDSGMDTSLFPSTWQVEENNVTLTQQQIETLSQTIEFNQAPIRITAFTSK